MSVGAIRAGRAMVEIFADSSALSRGLASAQSKMAKFAMTMRRLGTAQVLVGVGIAAPIAAAVKQYAALEQKLNTVRSLTGATAGQMQSLTQQVRQIGMVTGQPFTDIAEGMGDLSRAGVRIQDLGQATRVIADFSRAASVDMTRAANIGVQVLTEFGLSMDHLPRVADVLQEMANATVSTVEDLADGFRYAGQSSKVFGLSLEQAGSAIAFLQQSGLSASTAGTALNQMLLQMVQNLDKVESAVGGLRDAAGEFLPFDQILVKLREHVKNMPGPERLQFLNEMFDVRGMRGAEALLQNVEAWMSLNRQADNAMGASKQKASEMSKAFVVSFEKMRNGIVDMSYAIGEVLDGTLREAFSTLANLTSGLAPFIKANSGAVIAVAKFAAAITASGIAFFTTGIAIQLAAFSVEGFVKIGRAALSPITGIASALTMLGGVASNVAGNLMYAARGLGFLAAGMARNAAAIVVALSSQATTAAAIGPMIALGAAVGGVALAMSLLRKSAYGIGGLIEAIGSGASKVWQGLVDRTKQVFPEMRATVVTGWGGIIDAVNAGDLSQAWTVFRDTATAVFRQIMVIVGPFKDDFMVILSDIKKGASDAFWGGVDIAKKAFDVIHQYATPLVSLVADIGDSLSAGMLDSLESAKWSMTALGNIAEHAGNRIFEALSAGDIVRAWSEAVTAISSMFVVLGSAWEKHVAKPIQLAAVRAAEAVQEKEIRMQAHAAAGPEARKNFRRGDGSFADRIWDILDSGSPDQLQAAKGMAVAQTPQQERVLADAIDMVTARFKQLGIQSEEVRQAEVKRKISALYAAQTDRLKAIEDDRAAAAAKRRAAADEASARAAGSASQAKELRDRREFEQRIEAASNPAQLDALEKELAEMVQKRGALERQSGVRPKLVRDLDVERQRDAVAFARRGEAIAGTNQDAGAGRGKAASDAMAAAYKKGAERIAASRTNLDYATAVADMYAQLRQEAAKSGSMTPTGNTASGLAAMEKQFRDIAAEEMAWMQGLQQEDNESRAKVAQWMREAAAKERRGGNEEGAKAWENVAAGLEQAVDVLEQTGLLQKIDAQRARMAAEQEMRARQAGAGGEAAMKSKALDSIGGFMSSAFDRIGYSPNLAERQLKAAEEGAKAGKELVALVRNGGVFV